MDPIVFLKPPKIDPAVWRPDIPLVVIERCLHAGPLEDGRKVDSSKLICTWLAIRWLMAALPKRKGFSTRLIAERAGAHMTNITAWCQKLMVLGVLQKVGEEAPPRNLSRGGKQPIYSIPLAELERISHDICLEILINLGGGEENGNPPEGQMPLAFPLPDAEQNHGSDRLNDHGPDRLNDHGSDRLNDHGSDRLNDHGSDRLNDHGSDRLNDHQEGRKDHGKEGGGRARAEKRKPGRPPPLAPPDPPPGAYALPRHPIAQWQDACPQHRRADVDLLLALAAEHDESTGGYGLYWTGRAILAASLVEDVRQVGKIKRIMTRWRDTASYGSDLPTKESTDGRAPTGARRGATALDARPGDDRTPRGERGPVRSKLEY